MRSKADDRYFRELNTQAGLVDTSGFRTEGGRERSDQTNPELWLTSSPPSGDFEV